MGWNESVQSVKSVVKKISAPLKNRLASASIAPKPASSRFRRRAAWLTLAGVAFRVAFPAAHAAVDDAIAPLPPGVVAVWDAGRAFRESTATREKICINGLWRWQPAASDASMVPADRWGYFKVPGCWPGIT